VGQADPGQVDFDSVLAQTTGLIDKYLPTTGPGISAGPAFDTLAQLASQTLGGSGDSGTGWVYDREALQQAAESLLGALGVNWHDYGALVDQFPQEGADLNLKDLGELVLTAGNIICGRIDPAKAASMLGISTDEAQAWLTKLGNEYQMTGELMKAEGEKGTAYNAALWEENLLANLTNNLPEGVELTDLAGMVAGVAGADQLLQAFLAFADIEDFTPSQA
jgi:hypothetical protein